MKRAGWVAAVWFVGFAAVASAQEAVRLASDPALSPDGSTLAFAWRGDIWTVPIAGGIARPLTQHAGTDRQPHFSPDGTQIAFTGDRGQGAQVYLIPAGGA